MNHRIPNDKALLQTDGGKLLPRLKTTETNLRCFPLCLDHASFCPGGTVNGLKRYKHLAHLFYISLGGKKKRIYLKHRGEHFGAAVGLTLLITASMIKLEEICCVMREQQLPQEKKPRNLVVNQHWLADWLTGWMHVEVK